MSAGSRSRSGSTSRLVRVGSATVATRGRRFDRRGYRRGGVRLLGLWLAVYVVLTVLPLALGLIQLDPGRGFWTNLSVALGFVGLSMFGLQFAMAARNSIVSDPIGMDVVLVFHRAFGYLALVFVLAHPIILFAVDPRYLGLLDILSSPWRAKFAVVSVVALLLLVVLSAFRRRIRLGYEAWQISHAVLALVVVTAALLHTLMVGYYVDQPWERVVWIVYSALFVGLGLWVRIIKPLSRRRHAWTVESIEPEPGGAVTIVLRPLSSAAPLTGPFSFQAGQFAWIQARRSPFALTYHPFSFSSSAEHPERVTFTIKPHDGFSRDIQELAAGDRVYLDGPFGGFVLPESSPLILVGAGVGVTPLLSILETLADRGDPRPVALWLANRDEDSITCGAQLETVRARLPQLDLVHVLSRPGDGWVGARGHLDAAFVAGRMPADAAQREVLICGPEQLMNDVESALVAAGVPVENIHSERFGMV